MSFALTPERSWGFRVSEDNQAVDLKSRPQVSGSVIDVNPIFGGGNVIWGATPVAQLENGAIIYQDNEVIRGVTTAEIFSKVKSDSSGPLDFLQAGIVGLIASPLEIKGHPLNPIYCFGEAAAAKIFLMKKKALEESMGRTVGVTEVESKSLSEAFPNGSKAVNVLLALSLLAGAGLGVPTGNGNGNDGGGRGPDFSKILHWVLPIGGGITIEALLSACARAIGLPGPAVTVVTETPPAKLTPTEKPLATHTPTFTPPTQIPTETPFYGSGGSILPDGSPIQAQALLDLGMQLPSADCITAPNDSGNQEEWDSRINLLAEQGASAFAIADLQTNINDKLEFQGLNASTSLELCVGEGWGFAVRDNSSKLLWWPFDLDNNKFADRPDRWLGEGNWEFRQMPKTGLKDGLSVEVSLINGWPLALAVDKDNQPIQYFDTVLGEFRDFEQRITPTPDSIIVDNYYEMGPAEVRQVYQSEDITAEFMANPVDLQPIFFFHQNPFIKDYGREEVMSIQFLRLLNYKLEEVVLKDQVDQLPFYNAYFTVGYIDQTGKHTFSFEARSQFGTDRDLYIINPDTFSDRFQVGDEILAVFGYSSGGTSRDRQNSYMTSDSPLDQFARALNVIGPFGDKPISYETARSRFGDGKVIPSDELIVVTISPK